MMEVLHDRVAGLNVHKQTVVACVRSPGPGRSRRAGTREFETFIDDLERLRDWLVAEGVTHAAMEATGIYWKPVWFVLEDGGFELLLVNARNMRMVPGRKTDVAETGWIAQLLECAVAGQVGGSARLCFGVVVVRLGCRSVAGQGSLALGRSQSLRRRSFVKGFEAEAQRRQPQEDPTLAAKLRYVDPSCPPGVVARTYAALATTRLARSIRATSAGDWTQSCCD